LKDWKSVRENDDKQQHSYCHVHDRIAPRFSEESVSHNKASQEHGYGKRYDPEDIQLPQKPPSVSELAERCDQYSSAN
jgi:hypothetical protein